MKFIEKQENNIRANVGDFVILAKGNSLRQIICDHKTMENVYSLINILDGTITMNWYVSVEELLNNLNIKRIIPKETLELIEL